MTPQLHNPFVNGYILAGGRSRRMGCDKGSIELAGSTLIERTCLLLESVLGKRPALVGDDLQRWKSQGFKILPDAAHDKGPLGGLVSCLRDCGDRKWALILPVDMPYVSQFELHSLLQAVERDLDVVTLGESSTKMEPLAALYRGDTADFWETRLRRNQLSLQSGIRQLNHRVVTMAEHNRALVNLNTPVDLVEVVYSRG